MFDIRLRGLKDGVFDPVSQLIPSFITPSHITLAAFSCGLVSCSLAVIPSPHLTGTMWLPLCFWLLNRFLDCLDGSLARSRSCATKLGGFWDLLGDLTIYSLLPISIARGHSDLVTVDWTAVALLEATFHINNFVLFYIAAVAAGKEDSELTSVTMKPALIEGFESGLQFTAMLVWPTRINLWCWTLAAGVVIGTVQRVWTLVPILGRLDDDDK
jgi:phosphatidylglycerophosphate synthase